MVATGSTEHIGFCFTFSVVDAEQGLCDGRVSVRPSVCHIDRQQQWRPAGLPLSALQAGDID